MVTSGRDDDHTAAGVGARPRDIRRGRVLAVELHASLRGEIRVMIYVRAYIIIIITILPVLGRSNAFSRTPREISASLYYIIIIVLSYRPAATSTMYTIIYAQSYRAESSFPSTRTSTCRPLVYHTRTVFPPDNIIIFCIDIIYRYYDRAGDLKTFPRRRSGCVVHAHVRPSPAR